MSIIVCNRMTCITMLFCLMIFIGGCSGGGSSSARSGAVIDPSASYTGASTKAVPAETSAESLAMGGFGGTTIASAFQGMAQASISDATTSARNRTVFELAQTLKQSVRQMELPQKAAILRKSPPSPDRANAVGQRTLSYQIPGDNGGVANYTIDINDATGSFFGTIDYQGFTSSGLVIDGTADVLGTFDATQQQFSRFTLSFKSLTLHAASVAVSLTGSLSWAFNFDASTETLSMNMVLQDQVRNKTYWFKNYELATAYYRGGYTQTISGRYFDHDLGYVDLTTRTPLFINYGAQWPSEGSLAFTGDLGHWVRLSFLTSTIIIEVDTNGDGVTDWRVERPTIVIPPINTPPTADAGPDQAVSQWTTVQLDGSSSSDQEGDPLSYFWTVVSSPGYTPLSGANTATPSFTANLSGTYVLSLTVYDGNSTSQPDTVKVVVAPPTASDPSFVTQKWQYGIYGSSIGQAGLFTTDLDNDGTPEIIASASAGGFGSNVMWYIIRQSANGGYEQVWRSPIYGVTIVRILLADMNSDGKDDVVVAFTDGTIRIYDGPTLNEIKSFKVAASLQECAIADLDGDGSREIVISDGIGVSVYNAQTGALKWSLSSGGGTSIAIGNVDADPTPEIVTTTYGGKGYVLNGLTGEIKWTYINSFGAKVRLADLDDDGMQEIIGAAAWYKITIFDADLKTPTWEIATNLDIGAVTIVDEDGDGIPEIIYGDSQWGKIHAVDVRSRTERWSINNPEHGVSGIASGDVDKDGKKELLWGAGGSSTGPDFLYVANPLTGTIKWQNLDFSGLSTLAVGDVDDDGIDNIVMVSESSNSGYDGGIIHVFNARTHALNYKINLGQRDWMGYNRTVRIGDVDGDGHTELVISSSNLYDGSISIYDGANGTLKQQSSGYNGNFFSAIAIGDVDTDGKIEIVAGMGREHTGATGVYLIVFDGTTLQEKWRSVDLGVYWGSVYDIKLADLDKDGHPDIVATMANNRLIVFDGVTHTLKLMIESPARAIEIADVDSDGFPEILVGRNDGTINVYDGVTFTVKKSVFTYGTTQVDALRIADLDGDGNREWLVASSGVLSILDAQGLKWRSSYLGNNLGKNNSIAVKDVDGNGYQNIFIGTDPVLYEFE